MSGTLRASRTSASILTRKGLEDSALAIFDALLKTEPHDRDLLNMKALSLYSRGSTGDIDTSLKIFDELVIMFPHSGFGKHFFNRALVRATAGQSDGSLADLRRAVELEHWRAKARHVRDGGPRPSAARALYRIPGNRGGIDVP